LVKDIQPETENNQWITQNTAKPALSSHSRDEAKSAAPGRWLLNAGDLKASSWQRKTVTIGCIWQLLTTDSKGSVLKDQSCSSTAKRIGRWRLNQNLFATKTGQIQAIIQAIILHINIRSCVPKVHVINTFTYLIKVK
jgi:hypothetical protein